MTYTIELVDAGHDEEQFRHVLAAIAGALAETTAESIPESVRASLWLLDRSRYRPQLHVIRNDDNYPIAAVLTSARPHTAARKIVDVVAPDNETRRRLVDRVVADARVSTEVAALKWQWHSWSDSEGFPEIAAASGFVPLNAPYASISSTLNSGPDSVRGAVLWLRAKAPASAPYYGQTTDFTCGAVSLIMALQAGGGQLIRQGGELEQSSNRLEEMAIWRQATNMPACEPVGLAVAAADWLASHDGSIPEVHISTDRPVLLDGFGDDAAVWREQLQRESWRRAEQLGMPVVRDWVGMEVIFARVAAGASALLLIDEVPMHGDEVPHWVFMHAVVGEVAVVQDPWVDAAGGETWVDASELPISAADIDLMTRYEDPPVRGVVFLG